MASFIETGEHAVNFRRVLILLAIIMLQSCQKNSEDQEDTLNNKKYNRSDAATLNSQLGLAYLRQGDRPRAKRKLLLALEQSPDSANVNASMAYFMEKTGELSEARTFYQKAMSLAPSSGAQLNNYGTFLCRQGEYKQAENYFMKAVKDVKYDNTAAAYENAGLCALAIPDYTQASHYFNKAMEQDPSRKQSLFELIDIAFKQNQLDLALSYLQKYPMLSHRDPSLLALGADVASKAGKWDLEADYKRRLEQLNLSEKTGEKT